MKSIDIANFFIDYNNHSIDNTLTNLILHKFLYFAQGYCLALYNTPLFDEDIEAWKYGPVVPSVYQTYKYNKKENISKIKGDFSLDKYDSKTIELLLAVINDYGKYSSSELINITHEKGSPWDMVYKENENNLQVQVFQNCLLKYLQLHGFLHCVNEQIQWLLLSLVHQNYWHKLLHRTFCLKDK